MDIGLVSDNFIIDLAKENNLAIKEIYKHPNDYYRSKIKNRFDLIKSNSEIQIYQMVKN